MPRSPHCPARVGAPIPEDARQGRRSRHGAQPAPDGESDPFGPQKFERELVAVGQQVPRGSLRVEAYIEVLSVEAKMDERQDPWLPLDAVHRAPKVSHLDRARPEPFKVARFFAVECRGQKRRRQGLRRRGRTGRDVADKQLVGSRLLQELVDVPKMPAEQAVELGVVGGRRVIAVPPEPVAAFRDEHLFTSLGQVIRIDAGGRVDRLTGVGQLTPCSLIVGMADPDVEVRIDPGARKHAGELVRGLPTGVGHRDSPQVGIRREAAVQRAQEGPTAALEVFPGVFAVQDDWDEGIRPSRSRRISPAGLDEPRHEIAGGGVGSPPGVGKANEVGQEVIPKDTRNPRGSDLHAVGGIQLFRMVEMALAIASECGAERAGQNELVGRHPGEPGGCGQGNHRIRHRALRGPQTNRPPAEQALVKVRRACQLLHRVLRVHEALSRHLRVRVRPQVNIRIAQQWQNGVVERRRRDLDLTAGGRRPVLGDDLVEQLELHLVKQGLVILREAAPLGNEALDPRVAVQIDRIQPGELLPDLQIAQVLLAEALRGGSGVGHRW